MRIPLLRKIPICNQFVKSLSILLTIKIFIVCFVSHAFAQQVNAKNELNSQLTRLDSAFKNGDTTNFNQIVAFKGLQELYKSITEEKIERVPGKFRIISMNGDSATVFLSGIFLYGNSGDETNLSAKYSGIYKFVLNKGSWLLDKRIEIDRLNKIKKHNIDLTVIPGKAVKIIDKLAIDVNDPLGFSVKLNHRAILNQVLLNGVKAEYLFDGGMLWVNSQRKKNQQLTLEYSINVEKDEENTNSGYFGSSYGHIRNQYFWHPFFSFSSPNDRADFDLQCNIPGNFQLTTSLPQTESMVGDYRIITAKSELPTFGLSLYYDRDWTLSTLRKDKIDMVIYATPDFTPNKDTLANQFLKYYDILKSNFGEPISNYFGIVQDRTGGNGWKNRANSIIIAGQSGSYLITDKPNPRAIFGHEVAHAWTSPTGPATNFLMEGWATYAESMVLKSVYGDSIIPLFFESQKQNYLNAKFDRYKSLWDDYSNSGISYSKGAWLFYMLANQLGEEKFTAGMRRFIKSGKQNIHTFIAEMSKAAGKDMKPFLLSWLTSKQIPGLKVQQSAASIEFSQVGEIMNFDLEVVVKLKNGSHVSKTLHFSSRTQSVKIDVGEIESFILDPKHKLLFQLNADPS